MKPLKFYFAFSTLQSAIKQIWFKSVCLCSNQMWARGTLPAIKQIWFWKKIPFSKNMDHLSNQIIIPSRICSCISEFVFASDGFILVATFPAIFQYSFSVIFQYSHSIEHLSENVKSGLSMMHRLDANNTAETSNSEWLLQVRFYCASNDRCCCFFDKGEGLVT